MTSLHEQLEEAVRGKKLIQLQGPRASGKSTLLHDLVTRLNMTAKRRPFRVVTLKTVHDLQTYPLGHRLVFLLDNVDKATSHVALIKALRTTPRCGAVVIVTPEKLYHPTLQALGCVQLVMPPPTYARKAQIINAALGHKITPKARDDMAAAAGANLHRLVGYIDQYRGEGQDGTSDPDILLPCASDPLINTDDVFTALRAVWGAPKLQHDTLDAACEGFGGLDRVLDLVHHNLPDLESRQQLSDLDLLRYSGKAKAALQPLFVTTWQKNMRISLPKSHQSNHSSDLPPQLRRYLMFDSLRGPGRCLSVRELVDEVQYVRRLHGFYRPYSQMSPPDRKFLFSSDAEWEKHDELVDDHVYTWGPPRKRKICKLEARAQERGKTQGFFGPQMTHDKQGQLTYPLTKKRAKKPQATTLLTNFFSPIGNH